MSQSHLFLVSLPPPESFSPPASVLRLSRFLRRFLLVVAEGRRDLRAVKTKVSLDLTSLKGARILF